MYTQEQLDQILSEISTFKIELAEDPTLPELGNNYLRGLISKCRHYSNRVTFYIGQVAMHERELRRELQVRELDLEFKLKELLADDRLVRAQANIKDREAVAATLVKTEYLAVANLRVQIQDSQEVSKILKSTHRELSGTNRDIKMMRQMVKDDQDFGGGNGNGYVPPNRQQDKSVPDGMPAAVRQKLVNPTDLLDDDKRPADLPKPVDAGHASQIANFLNSAPEDPPEVPTTDSADNDETPKSGFSFEDLLD